LIDDLCSQCFCPDHAGMSCVWCGCFYIGEKRMKKDEAIDILLKYVETDHADDNLQAAVKVLKQEKNDVKVDNIINIP
jgi:hypothetical protein